MQLSNFWQNIILVFKGALLAQLIPMIGYIIIALYVLPREFGIYAIWLGVTKMVSVISTLRLEVSLFNELDGSQRDRALVLIIYISLIVSIFLSALLAAVFFLNLFALDNFSFIFWILIIPCSIIFAIDNNLRDWTRADGRYEDLNKIRLSQAILTVSFQFVLIAYSATADSLIAGMLIGSFAGLLYAYKLKPIKFFINRNLQKDLVNYIFKHKRFVTFTFPADAISTLLAQLPLWIFAARFGLETSGQLALVLRTMKAPVALLGNSIQDVFVRQAMKDFEDQGNCTHIFQRSFLILTLGALLFLTFSLFFVEDLFVLFFGEIWTLAGKYAFYLSPLFALGFIASPLSILVFIVKRQDIDFLWHLCLLPLVLISLLLPNTDFQVIFLYVLVFSLMHIVYSLITYRLSLGGNLFDLSKLRQ